MNRHEDTSPRLLRACFWTPTARRGNTVFVSLKDDRMYVEDYVI